MQKKNIRILKLEDIGYNPDTVPLDIKKVGGGLLLQELDTTLFNDSELKVVTDKSPTDEEMEDLIFAWKVVKHTKSNGIARQG